jgi:4-hydroxy-tetrahydrodipicolinate reductase
MAITRGGQGMDSGRLHPFRLGVAGALGRMGQAVIALACERDDVELAAAVDRPDANPARVQGVALVTTETALAACDAIIDFTTAQASTALARMAATRGGPPVVIGSTGFSDEEESALVEASTRVAIVKSGNFSLGLNVMAGLVAQAARRLGAEDWDIEILEAHHRRKVDAPSGTALMLGEAAAGGRGASLADVSVRGRDGMTGVRPAGAIGFAVVRGGGLVGEHSVILAADDEIVTLSHSARDRRLFARGAVEAALWVRGRPPGLYDMRDVLGFRD